MEYGISEDPRESLSWRRHTRGCPHYRERWFTESSATAGEPIYQVFCLMNTPPTSVDEQEKCLSSRTRCWRVAEHPRKSTAGVDIPVASVKRRQSSRPVGERPAAM